MPVPTLVATPGAANANAYATVAEAIAYHDARLHVDDWTAASTDLRTVALIMATRLLDSLYDWTGFVVAESQALLWPRTGMRYRNGYYVPTDVIPRELKEATAEYARQLLVEDRSADSAVETQGLRSLTAGPVSLVFADSVTAKVIPDAVFHLIPAEWGMPRGRAAGVRNVVRA